MVLQPYRKPRPEFRYLPALLLAVWTILFGTLILRLPADFWIEDDTMHLVFVRDHPNPLSYFTKEGIHAFSFGRTLTPMLPLSFWIDYRLAPLVPSLAYYHAVGSLVLAVLLLYGLLRQFLPVTPAWFGCVLWSMLPSTISVVEFLAARHYLEGLIFLLAGLQCLIRACDTGGRKGWVLAGLFVAAYLAASCAKEIFVTTGFWLPACICLLRRRWDLLAFISIGPILYFSYRMLTIGLVGKGFGDSGSFLDQYHVFLARLPFIFAGNPGGLWLFATVGVLCLFLLWRRRIGLTHLFFGGSNILLLLATIYPVSQHLSASFLELGTWYRVAFLLNSFLLVAGIWLFSHCPKPWAAIGGLAAFLVVGHGSATAIAGWDTLKHWHREDAQTYLAHPDRLLYSSLPAPWFIQGVHTLYLVDKPRNYLAHNSLASEVADRFSRGDVIWHRGRDGVYRPDPLLYRTIVRNTAKGVRPLHKPVDPKDLDPVMHGKTPWSTAQGIDYRQGHLYLEDFQAAVWPLAEPHRSVYLLNSANHTNGIWFLASESGETNTVLLEVFDFHGRILERRERTLAPRSFILEPALPHPEDTLLAISADHPVRSTVIYRQGLLQWSAHNAGIPQTAGEFWIPHIPSDQNGWSFHLLLGNTTGEDLSGQLTLIDEKGQEREKHISVPGQGLQTWKPFETDNFRPVAIRLRLPSPGLMVGQEIRHLASGGNVLLPPANLQVLRGPLDPVDIPPEAYWYGLVFFNPGSQPNLLSLTDASGLVLKSWSIPPGDRLLLGPATELPRSSGIGFQTTGPVAALTLLLSSEGNLRDPRMPIKTESRKPR